MTGYQPGVEPETRYARSGSTNIAYRVFGSGPVDLVLVPGFISHVEFAWREPLLARFMRNLSVFARVIAFDRRGMGLSDRNERHEAAPLGERIDDILTVMRAADSQRAALLAWSEGGPTSILFAHEHREHVIALILIGTTAKFCADEDFPEGVPRRVFSVFVDTMEEYWGTGVGLELYAPTMAEHPPMRRWWAAYQRYSSSPGTVAASLRMHVDVDVRSILPKLHVPTLVIHRENDMLVPVECGRYTAAHIPGAQYLELPGDDHMYWLGDQDATLTSLAEFLTGTAEGASIATLRRRRGRPASGWESLTDAELGVVHLLTTGLTNRQIAERLYLSPQTVQTHVAHVLAKLGVSRRSQVAAEAARRSVPRD